MTIMKITVQSSKIVKPAYGDHGDSAPAPSTDDVIPLSVFDKVTFDQYISSMHFFRPPAPPTAALELGLAKMLAEFRVWAGRLVADPATGTKRAILLNDAGARFVVATCAAPLDSVMPREPSPEVFALHPKGEDETEELMLVQVTRFACGCFVVGTTVRHPVTDGRAARSFMTAWGQATRGVPIYPRPVHDRVSFFRPREPARVEFEHRGAEFVKPSRGGAGGEKKGNSVNNNTDDDPNNNDKVVMHRVDLTLEMLAELKSLASADGTKTYSTLQCLVAHLWRCLTKSRGLGLTNPTLTTRARIAVNGRGRMRDLPDEYIGNAVLWAWPTTTVGDLLSRPLSHAADLVAHAVKRVADERYFKSFIDFASSGAVGNEGLAPSADPNKTVLCPDVEVDSLLGFPFQGLDFGTGPPFFYMPSYLPVEGGMFFVPSFDGDGSVHAYVPLFSRNLEAFDECCFAFIRAGPAALLEEAPHPQGAEIKLEAGPCSLYRPTMLITGQ